MRFFATTTDYAVTLSTGDTRWVTTIFTDILTVDDSIDGEQALQRSQGET